MFQLNKVKNNFYLNRIFTLKIFVTKENELL